MKAVYAAGTDYDNPLSQLKVGELDTPETKLDLKIEGM